MIDDFVILDDIQINLHHRDNIVKLQSLILNQLQSPKFKDWIKYSWQKAGYYGDMVLPKFVHPIKYCFDISHMPETVSD